MGEGALYRVRTRSPACLRQLVKEQTRHRRGQLLISPCQTIRPPALIKEKRFHPASDVTDPQVVARTQHELSGLISKTVGKGDAAETRINTETQHPHPPYAEQSILSYDENYVRVPVSPQERRAGGSADGEQRKSREMLMGGNKRQGLSRRPGACRSHTWPVGGGGETEGSEN